MLIYIIFKVKIVNRYLNAMVFGQVNFILRPMVYETIKMFKKSLTIYKVND